MTTIPLSDSIVSATNNPQMAIEILGRLMGLDGAREVMSDVWKIGQYRSRDVYYANTLTDAVRALVEGNPRAICLYGKPSGGITFGTAAKRCRLLAELVVCGSESSELTLDQTVLDALVPPKTARLIRSQKGAGILSRLHDWMRLMEDWLRILRDEAARAREGKRTPPRFGPPNYDWIFWWFEVHASLQTRVAKPSTRTLLRDLHELRDPKSGSVMEHLSAPFYYAWKQCRDEQFVIKHSHKSLTAVVKRALMHDGKPPPDMLPPTDAYGHPAYRKVS